MENKREKPQIVKICQIQLTFYALILRHSTRILNNSRTTEANNIKLVKQKAKNRE